MISIIDQIQDRWQRVEADRAPQKRKERFAYQRSAGSKSGKRDPDELEEGKDQSHLDLTA